MNLSEQDAQNVMNMASELGKLRSEAAALRAERDTLREANAELSRSLSIMAGLVAVKYGNLDSDVWAELERARRALEATHE